MKYKMIIGGDLVPTKSNEEIFINGNIEKIVDDKILKILEEANYRVFNLETPLTDSNHPISKEGPALKAKKETINGIKRINPDLITIANNHILDYGQEGLQDTIEELRKNNISYVGAGNNLEEASKGFIIENNGFKIGIYGCSEHEYTIATKTEGGANPFDPLESLDQIENLRKNTNYVIVLYHGGKEFYRYPTPYLQKVCRKIIDKGADLVLCQHSHCIGTYEDYKNGKIVYGQGNFLFDRDDPINYECKQTGLLVELLFDENDEKATINFYPIRKNQEGIKLADDNDSEEILKGFEERANQIKEDNFIEENFDNRIKEEGARYLFRLSKTGTIISAVDRRYFKEKLLHRKFKNYFSLRQRHTLENMLQCEVHNEVVLRYLKMLNKADGGKKD